MSHINEWAKDKPLPLAMIAIELAFDAECCFECAGDKKAGLNPLKVSGLRWPFLIHLTNYYSYGTLYRLSCIFMV